MAPLCHRGGAGVFVDPSYVSCAYVVTKRNAARGHRESSDVDSLLILVGNREADDDHEDRSQSGYGAGETSRGGAAPGLNAGRHDPRLSGDDRPACEDLTGPPRMAVSRFLGPTGIAASLAATTLTGQVISRPM